ncbi:MAG: hypothetical protein ACP5DY_06300 [Thermovirgaceae bacterium]
MKTRDAAERRPGTFRFRRATALFLIVLVVFISSGPAFADEPVEIWVTHPWLEMTTRFIGGAYCSVHSIQKWDESGALERSAEAPVNAIVLAFDPSDAKTSGVMDKNKTVLLLYKRDLGGLDNPDMPFLDPATLPFIGLRILKNISQVDPGNYAYYQRRLAEFSARLDSTVLVGRQMLGATRLLDLSWQVGRWIQAATSDIVRPPGAVKENWEKGHDMKTLEIAIQEAKRQGWLILCDPWTPEQVSEKIGESASCLVVPGPSEGQDFFLYLYDLYLFVWDRLRSPGIEGGLAHR